MDARSIIRKGDQQASLDFDFFRCKELVKILVCQMNVAMDFSVGVFANCEQLLH